MKCKLMLAIVVACVLGISYPAFSLNITAMDSAGNLAQHLLGSGVTISNVTYSGATAAAGYFSGGTDAGIGIENGIVLTTGYASNLNGTTNTSYGITGANNQPGDTNLNALIPGYQTHDAAVLEFDFTSNSDAAYFNYIFGSEEYNEFVGSSFNDVFGFFVDGVNYALIPGTNTPVAINTVNNSTNSAYYNSNDPSDDGTPTPYPFEYDGFTDVFTAAITGLTPGETYHIKLAIADAGDSILDSGVFLETGSFSDTPNPVPEPSTVLLLGMGLLGLAGFGRKQFSKES